MKEPSKEPTQNKGVIMDKLTEWEQKKVQEFIATKGVTKIEVKEPEPTVTVSPKTYTVYEAASFTGV